MISPFPTIPRVSFVRPEAARMLALRLVCAEEDLHLLARGEIDAIIGPRGNTYLLRAAQERLQEDVALYRALVDGAPDGILVTDRAEKKIFQNRRLAEDCQEHVRTIVSSGEALLRILDDVLISSRLEAGRLPLECTPISPGDILRDIQAFLTLPAGKKGLALFVAIEEGVPPQLTNDAGRLRQVLLNLASNAVKFTSRGSVTLGVQPTAGAPGVMFFVRDTGEGIPRETLGAIFDPFAQADPSVGRRHGGTGLGLSISRDLTELMGGKLTVKSEVGVGSVFTVTLPLSAPEAEGEP